MASVDEKEKKQEELVLESAHSSSWMARIMRKSRGNGRIGESEKTAVLLQDARGKNDIQKTLKLEQMDERDKNIRDSSLKKLSKKPSKDRLKIETEQNLAKKIDKEVKKTTTKVAKDKIVFDTGKSIDTLLEMNTPAINSVNKTQQDSSTKLFHTSELLLDVEDGVHERDCDKEAEITLQKTSSHRKKLQRANSISESEIVMFTPSRCSRSCRKRKTRQNSLPAIQTPVTINPILLSNISSLNDEKDKNEQLVKSTQVISRKTTELSKALHGTEELDGTPEKYVPLSISLHLPIDKIDEGTEEVDTLGFVQTTQDDDDSVFLNEEISCYIPSVKVQGASYSNTDTEEDINHEDGSSKTLSQVPASLELPNVQEYHSSESSFDISKVDDCNCELQGFRMRAVSLPGRMQMNPNDLSRLTGLYEKAKGKKSGDLSLNVPYAKSPSPSMEPSLLNRIARKLSPGNGKRETIRSMKKESSFENRRPRSRSPSPSRFNVIGKESSSDSINVSPPNIKRNKSHPVHSRKFFERRNTSVIESKDNKTKSSKGGNKLARKSDQLLQQAVTQKNIDMLEKLLSEETSLSAINYLEPPGVSVFHQACVFGDIHIIKLLLMKGADVCLKTWSKLSPLRIAVIFGHYEVAQLLLMNGADLNDIKDGFQGEND